MELSLGGDQAGKTITGTLSTIASAGMVPIYCFVAGHELRETADAFRALHHNIVFLPFEVDRFPFSTEIQTIKQHSPDVPNRRLRSVD
jgi:hypothetical protein